MFIIRTRPNVLTVNGTFLYPGVNFISEKEKTDALLKLDVIKELITAGYLIVLETTGETFSDALASLKAKDAVEVVNHILVEADIVELIGREKRAQVLEAAKARLETLVNHENFEPVMVHPEPMNDSLGHER